MYRPRPMQNHALNPKLRVQGHSVGCKVAWDPNCTIMLYYDVVF